MNRIVLILAMVLLSAPSLMAQHSGGAPLWEDPTLQFPGMVAAPPPLRQVENTPKNGPTATLYRSVRSVGLDEKKVFHVREAVMDRDDLHLYLTDGTIAFTEEVEGRVTGAYFVGEGEVLMRPPNITEHASLGLFSGMGMLDEHFPAAYFRFNDDLLDQLKPYLRETEEQQEFIAAHGERAHELAELDALRLVESFMEDPALASMDHFLHARLATRFGNLDVYDDSLQEDRFTVGSLGESRDNYYFDVWMAFPSRKSTSTGARRVIDPVASASAVPVTAFHIDTVLTPPETLEATADLDLEVRDGGQRLLMFELSRWLRVSSVRVDGVEVEFLQNEALTGSELARVGNDLVTVVMPCTLRAGEHYQVQFHYAGAVMQQAAPGLLYVGARGTWYPNRGMQMSRFNLNFRWPQAWTLVATGHPISTREEGDQRVGEWSSEGDIPLAGFNLGRFVRASAQAKEVTVASYSAGVVEESLAKASPVLASESSARNAAIAQRSAEDIQKYSAWFGPYPYKELALTQLPGPVSQGWPTLVYLSSYAYLNDQERRALSLDEFRQLIYGNFMLDHETAHQWWGDRVAWQGYRDQWLMEALSNLSAYMIMEEKEPARARALLEFYREELLVTNAKGKSYADAGPVTLGYRLSSSIFPNAYIPVTYGRGLWLMLMLRDYFADYEKLEKKITPASTAEGGRFLAALREFGRRYDRSTATTDDFRKVLEEFLPPKAQFEGVRSLKWFFDEWVRGSSVPWIGLKKVTFLQRNGTTVASFNITQQQVPDSLITSVPIFAELAGGERVFVQRVFADGNESHQEIKVPPGTRKLLVDPERRLLRLY